MSANNKKHKNKKHNNHPIPHNQAENPAQASEKSAHIQEFSDVLKKRLSVGVRIDLSKSGMPVTLAKEFQPQKKIPAVNLDELINAEDWVAFLEQADELMAIGAGNLRVKCRFVPENKTCLICCELRREKWFGKNCDSLLGVITDVSEYHEGRGNNSDESAFCRANAAKFSAGEMGLAEIVGVEELLRVQSPLVGAINSASRTASGKPELYSAFVSTEDGAVICAASPELSGKTAAAYRFSRREYINVNRAAYAVWVIASDDEGLIGRLSSLHAIMAESVSKLANSYVMLYNEMVGIEQANKLMSETIEQQMLLNSIYTKVLNEPISPKTILSVVKLAGDFLKLDRIVICDDDPDDARYTVLYEWLPRGESRAIAGKSFKHADYPVLTEELGYYETYFSSDPSHGVFGLEYSSYVASNLYGDGSKHGVILYLVNSPERILSHAEKRLLRSVSQIVAAVMMRCRDTERIDSAEQRLEELSGYDPILGIKNKMSLQEDVSQALNSGKPGAVVAFRLPNLRNINHFSGYGHTDGLRAEILAYIKEYSGQSKTKAESYRFSDEVFAVLLRETAVGGAVEFCEYLTARFSRVWCYNDSEHYLDISLGIAAYNDDSDGRGDSPLITAENLFRAAIMSMHKAEEYGVNRYAVYSRKFENSEADDYYCTQVLRNAAENSMEGLAVKYSPVYAYANDAPDCGYAREEQIVSCEAALAFAPPVDSLYSPQTLMKIAARMGIDVKIDSWLIRQACDFCKTVRGLGREDFTVCVNVSARTLASGSTANIVRKALNETGLAPDGLTVQFSEEIIATNPAKFNEAVGKLQAMGVSAALDYLCSHYNVREILRRSGIRAAKADISLFTGRIDEFDGEYISGLMRLARKNNVAFGIRAVDDEQLYEIGQAEGADCYQSGNFTAAMNETEFLFLLSREFQTFR